MGERFEFPELVLVVAERQDSIGCQRLDQVGGGQVVLPAEPGTERVRRDVPGRDQHRISGRLRASWRGGKATEGGKEHQQHAGHGDARGR